MQKLPGKNEQIIGSVKRKRTSVKLGDLYNRIPKIVKMLFICLILVVLSLWYWQSRPNISSSQVDVEIKKSLTQANAGKFSDSLKTLNAVEQKRLRKSDKQKVLETEGLLYAKYKQTDKAFVYLLNAENAYGQPLQFSSYSVLASIYESKKENTKAIEYYQKAIDQLKYSDLPRANNYIQQYTTSIERLKGSQK